MSILQMILTVSGLGTATPDPVNEITLNGQTVTINGQTATLTS